MFSYRIEYTPVHTYPSRGTWCEPLAQRHHACARSFIPKAGGRREVDGTQPFNNRGMLEFAGVVGLHVRQRLVG